MNHWFNKLDWKNPSTYDSTFQELLFCETVWISRPNIKLLVQNRHEKSLNFNMLMRIENSRCVLPPSVFSPFNYSKKVSLWSTIANSTLYKYGIMLSPIEHFIVLLS